MEYRRINKHYITSVLRGKEPPKRIIKGKIVSSTDLDKNPLVRVWSRNEDKFDKGRYGLAVLDDKWDLWKERFTTLAEAEKYLAGLHLVYKEVCIVQYWNDKQSVKLARENDVDNENTGEI